MKPPTEDYDIIDADTMPVTAAALRDKYRVKLSSIEMTNVAGAIKRLLKCIDMLYNNWIILKCLNTTKYEYIV